MELRNFYVELISRGIRLGLLILQSEKKIFQDEREFTFRNGKRIIFRN